MSDTDSSINKEDERQEEPKACTPFRFFDLPSELRAHILSYLIVFLQTIDLPRQPPCNLLGLFLASRRMHREASRLFYGQNTFRIYPTNGGYFGPRVVPLLARFPKRYRECLTSLELRLGPGWRDPPKWWKVYRNGNDWLKLSQMKEVRSLKVFVEADPSQEAFRKFRKSKDLFTDFSLQLVKDILNTLPGLRRVEFDAWPSVVLDGDLMVALLQEVKRRGLGVGISKQLVESDERYDPVRKESTAAEQRELSRRLELDRRLELAGL